MGSNHNTAPVGGERRETAGKTYRRWPGRLVSGTLYCDCDDHKAICRTAKQGKNKGKRFWTCPKETDPQCGFFIWVHRENEAKDWLKNNPPSPHIPPVPETPTKNAAQNSHEAATPRSEMSDLPRERETPFTKAKRKPVSREVSDEQKPDQPLLVTSPTRPETAETPPRKVIKQTRFSTPGQTFSKKLAADAAAMPTPESGLRTRTTISRPRRREESPSPAGPSRLSAPIELRGEGGKSPQEDLTTTVLQLLRADGAKVKESTEMQIQHVIELELELRDTRLRKAEELIAKLTDRFEKSERSLELLTDGATVDDLVDISD